MVSDMDSYTVAPLYFGVPMVRYNILKYFNSPSNCDVKLYQLIKLKVLKFVLADVSDEHVYDEETELLSRQVNSIIILLMYFQISST